MKKHYKICFWTDFTGRNEEGIKLHQAIIDQFPYNELAWFNLAAAYQGIKPLRKSRLMLTNMQWLLMKNLTMPGAIWATPI